MKKKLLSLIALLWACSSAFAQSTIIAQWTFPDAADTTLFPDSSISANATKYLSAEDTTAWPNTKLRDVSMTQGATTYAATASGWQNGKDAKVWSIKIKTNSCSNITVSSKQRSSGNTPGPKYWKIQAKSTSFIDVPGGNIVCANDWTTGVVTDLPLPASFNNLSGSIYIRWMVTYDSSTAGTIVDSLGISMIDDVIIKGTSSSGVEEVLYESEFNFYPNPNFEKNLSVSSTKHIQEIKIFNIQGQIIKSIRNIGVNLSVNIEDLKQGVYFIQAIFDNNKTSSPRKLIVE